MLLDGKKGGGDSRRRLPVTFENQRDLFSSYIISYLYNLFYMRRDIIPFQRIGDKQFFKLCWLKATLSCKVVRVVQSDNWSLKGNMKLSSITRRLF